MAYELIRGRLLVLLDEGKDDRGTIFQSSLNGYPGLVFSQEPENPEDPQPPHESYNHVVFVKNMSETVAIDGVDYQAMHRNALVGVITD